MSFTNLDLSNIKHHRVDNEHTLCFCNLSIGTDDSNLFEVEGNIKNNIHIITTDPGSDFKIKNLMINSPLINKYSVTVYDYSSNVINKYLSGRTNNTHGSIENKLPKIKFLSQIIIPNVDKDDKIYIILNSYSGIEELLLNSSKLSLINKDLNKFKIDNIKNNSNLDFNQIQFVITDILNDKITNIYYVNENLDVKISEIFSNAIISNSTESALIELLMGKCIQSCDEVSQGLINIDSEKDDKYFDILNVLCDKSKNVTMTARRNGILQVNSQKNNQEIKFVLILKNSDKDFTNVIFKYFEKEYISEECNDNSEDFIFECKELVDNFNFLNLLSQLNSNIGNEILIENSVKVINYLLFDKLSESSILSSTNLTDLEDKYLYTIDENKELSFINYIDMIKKFNYNFKTKIKNKLMNFLNFNKKNGMMLIQTPEPLNRHVSAANF